MHCWALTQPRPCSRVHGRGHCQCASLLPRSAHMYRLRLPLLALRQAQPVRLSGPARVQAGAQLNSTFQARDGLDASFFPAKTQIYSGHYHIPHTVARASNVRYVGSPYQGVSPATPSIARTCVRCSAAWCTGA